MYAEAENFPWDHQSKVVGYVGVEDSKASKKSDFKNLGEKNCSRIG